jgi:cell division protein FtsA
VPRKRLAKIIEPRVEEILDLAMQEVEDAGYRDLIPAGMVLTGGTSLLHGIVEFAQRRYGIPVRRGSVPKDIHGFQEIVESPIFATGVGLLKFAVEGKDFVRGIQARRTKGLMARLFGWFRQFLRGG